MRSKNKHLIEEVSELIEQVTFEEVSVAVWNKFEQALLSLDRDELNLLQTFLNGMTIEKLSKSRNLTEDQIRTWINSLKRELIRSLRSQTETRN